MYLQYAFGDPTNLLIKYSPTFRDRDDLLRKSEKQFEISDESAYSIVPSRMSMSIYTCHTIDSGASKSEESLVYKPLAFEDELFTARVYKRNYRTTTVQRLLKGTEQKPSGKTNPRTMAQETVEGHVGSEAEDLMIMGPGLMQRRPSKAQSATSIATEGQPAGDEDNSGEMNTAPNAELSIAFAEACEQGNVEFVETFLQSGGNVNAFVSGKSHRVPDLSPIHFATKGGHVRVVEILLSYGADKEMLSCVSRKRPLHLAVWVGHLAMVRCLLDNGTNIAATDGESAQAIHLAAHRGSIAILSLLLDCGAAIDSAMTDGAQPLHMASRNRGRVNVIKFLCGQGADIEARTNRGRTPLYYACLHNAVDNMEALLKLGATYVLQGSSILNIALERDHLEATRLLLQCGLDPNCPVSSRPSALHRLITMDKEFDSDEYYWPNHVGTVELSWNMVQT